MATTVQDILKANLVLVGAGLLGHPGELDKFRDAIDEEIIQSVGLVTTIPAGVTEAGSTLNLPKDRITLELSQHRSTISREYPSDGDLARLARVAGLAIQATNTEDQAPRAFGYNIELVFDQDSGGPAISYLGARLFAEGPRVDQEWRLAGGAGQLIYDGGGKRWKISVAPRLNDEESSRVFLSLNLHIAEQRIPGESEIQKDLQEAWDQAHRFVELLDQGVQ